LELPKAPSDFTFLHQFERVDLEQLFGLQSKSMLAQITANNKGFDQLFCDGNTFRGSVAQPDGAGRVPLRGVNPEARLP
jgi:hypothetical protein